MSKCTHLPKHGHWIISGTFGDFFKCPECGYKVPINRVLEENWHGCPCCLAKMDEEIKKTREREKRNKKDYCHDQSRRTAK